MNIVFTARKSSAVFHAIKGNFTGPNDLNLILGKGTRVEVYLIGDDGLKMIKEFSIYGEIACLEPFRPPGYNMDMLLLTTTHYQMLTLSLRLSSSGANLGEISTGITPQFNIISDSLIDLQDRHARPYERGQIVIIDPTCSIVCCHLYQGLLKCIIVNPNASLSGPSSHQQGRNAIGHSSRSSTKVSDKTFVDWFNLPIDEVSIISMVFLHGCQRPTLAVLYQDKKEIRHVKTYEFDLKGKEKLATTWSQGGLNGAATCIAVPAPIGGLLIVGEYAISYFNPAYPSETRSITIEATSMQCYNRVDDQGSRYLLGDYKGKLYILVLNLTDLQTPSTSSQSSRPLQVADLRLECLGTTSIPEAIVYLDNDHVFVGSHFGDSQLVLLHTDADQHGEYLEVMETFTNIAPLTDFEVVDLEGQGQGQIVACSGAFKDGSLRIIRNGVGINDKAVLELPGIKGLWSLKGNLDAETEDTLVMSFLNSTRVVRVTPDTEMVQEDLEGFVNDSPTLLCGNVQANLVLQVTPESVRLVAPTQHIQSGLISEWKPPMGQLISMASMNGTQCLAAVGGKTLVYLDVGSETIKEVGRTTFENEIACIDVTSIDITNRHASQVCAVGLWTDIRVILVRLPTMEILASYGLPGEILPRSLLLSRFEGVPYLLVGLGDGQLLTFNLDANLSSLPSPKRISLGTQPIMLRQISSTTGGNGAGGASSHVFACSDRPTVIYSSNRKLLYSNVNLKQVTTVTSFNCEAFPDALAIVGSDEEGVLRIGSIDEFQELHVQTFPINESPRRIAYLASKKCFGVLSIRIVSTKPETVGSSKIEVCEEEEVGFVRLHDDQTFDVLHTYEIPKDEVPQCIAVVQFAGDPTHYIAVGTADTVSEDIPEWGRILILEVSETSQLKLVTEVEVKGGVMAIKEFQGKLLCGINERLCLYSWNTADTLVAQSNLVLEYTHRGFITVISLAVHGEFIVAGDLIRSMALLRYTDKKIVEISRDTNTDMLMAVDMIDDDTFVASNNASSIFSMVKNTETTSEDEAKRLLWSGGWHLSDQVNQFRHGSLVMANQEGDAPATPKLLFATVSGAIGVVATLTKDMYELFHHLETNMSKVIKGVGGLDHTSWRTFRSHARTLASENFVDGDLIELFLDLSQDEVNHVLEGPDGCQPIKTPVDELIRLVEELSRLH